MSTMLLASAGLRAITQVAPPTSKRRLGFVATAGEVMPNPVWVERDAFSLRRIGYEMSVVHLVEGAEAELRKQCADFDVIFVAGGNTYYLLQQMRLSGFDTVLTEFLHRGGVYVGSSAGAIVAGPDIDITAEHDQKPEATRLDSTVGLGLVPFCVLPHVNSNTSRFFDHQLRVFGSQSPHPVQRIADHEAVLVEDGKVSVVWSPMLP